MNFAVGIYGYCFTRLSRKETYRYELYWCGMITNRQKRQGLSSSLVGGRRGDVLVLPSGTLRTDILCQRRVDIELTVTISRVILSPFVRLNEAPV